MLFRDLPIRRKLVGLMSLISLSVLIVAGSVMLAYEFGNSRRDMAAKLGTTGKIISANSAAGLVMNEVGAAHETLSALKAEPEIRSAALYDKNGRLFARYPAGKPAGEFPANPSLQEPQFGRDALTLTIPVYQGQRQVGSLFLMADYRNLSHRMFVYGVVLALILAGSGALSFFLSNRFESRISQPLLDLASVARAISEEGDYSVRAVKTGADELGILEDAFNSMLAQIQKGDAALRDSEQRFRMVADNISVLAWTADELGLGVWYNKRWHEYTGLSVEESKGTGWERLQHPDHLARVKRGLVEAFARKTAWEDTFPLKGADGQFRWFLSRAVPIFDEKGNILRWFGTNVDITELLEAERSVGHLAAIVKSSHDAIVSKTLEGVIRTWNRGAEQMFGYTAAEAIGQPITMIIPSELRIEEETILERQRRGESIEHFETIRVRKDGTQIEVSLSISPLRDSRGTIVGVSKIARDITEKKRSERALQNALIAAKAANRAKDDFLAALSHELRTPLMPVMFTISSMQQDAGLPSSLQANLAVVRRNLEIQVRMINDLIDLSRIRANRLELVFEVVDLHETITRAFEVCRGHQKFPDMNIELKLGAQRYFVRADADRMQQVFWNLIQNAIKFTPAGGGITIRSNDRAGTLCVTVTDTGCGIEPDVLTKIFEPFEQGGRKSKETLQGLGLGLAIARRIVVAHGGTLTASSEGKGLGATFTLELQAVRPPPAMISSDPHQPELLSKQ